MLLSDLVATSQLVSAEGGRKAKTAALAALLARTPAELVRRVVAMLAGERPTGRIGVGWASLERAHAAPPAATPTLELRTVLALFEQVAATSGPGSTSRRRALLAELFGRTTGAERDFLLRLFAGELRQGAQEGVMVEALAQAFSLPAPLVRRAVMLAGNTPEVAAAAAREGAAGLDRFDLVLFRPLQPMLAQTAETIEQAFAALGPSFALEVKLDGARVQVHRRGDEVRVYSRQQNEVTAAVPEVVEVVRSFGARELVLDGETYVVRPDGGMVPFQVTMRRFGRRLDVDALRAELPLEVRFFDCLYRDGESLLERSYAERTEALAAIAGPAHRVQRTIGADVRDAEAFYSSVLARGPEGVRATSLAAPDSAGARGAAWLKIKRVVTLDLVVLAAEWGHGRRRGSLSNLHLGARDPATATYVMLGKTFKGLTDELLRWQTERLLALETHRDPLTVWVRPELVVEIAYSDLQASPHYPGGLALRFARVKQYRPDKTAADADTIDTVRALYAAQGVR